MTADITFQKELFVPLMPELPELFMREYEEAVEDKERHKLKPAWQRYAELEMAGVLHVLTARAGTVLAGYFMSMVYPHMQFADLLCASSDSMYLLPQYRRGMAGVKLFTENEKMLKKLGVQKSLIIIAEHSPNAVIMKRLKYKRSAGIFSKWL